GGCRPRAGRRRRAPAAALPGPEHQAFPGGPDVVPALADRSGARHAAAADTGDRPGRARVDRRTSRDRGVRPGSGFPRPAVRARRRAPQGTAPQDRRARAGAAGNPAVRRSRRRSADRERHRRRRGPRPPHRPRLVLPPGGSLVDAGHLTGGPAAWPSWLPGRCRGLGWLTVKLATALAPPAAVTSTR